MSLKNTTLGQDSGMYQYGIGQTSNYGIFRHGSPAGTEIIPVFYGENTGPIELGDIDTISYSTHRELTQIRPLGRVGPAGFVQGKRTIAGSIIIKLREGSEIRKILGSTAPYYNRMLHDELPPFNIVIVMPAMTDDGLIDPNLSPYVIVISGIKIVDTASSVSVDDTLIEQQFSYIATDIRDMTSSTLIHSYHPEEEIIPVNDSTQDKPIYSDDLTNLSNLENA